MINTNTTQRTALAYVLKKKDLSFFRRLKPDMFITRLKDIYFFIDNFEKEKGFLPSFNLLKDYIKLKVKEKDELNYISLLESFEDIDTNDVNKNGLLEILIESYQLNVIDKHIETLVYKLKEKDKTAINLIKRIEEELSIVAKSATDVKDADYNPINIKLIEPFMKSMKDKNLMLGGLSIIGGLSGGGKSIFTLQQLLHSYKQGENVCLFNLELGNDETIARMYCCENQEYFKEVYGNPDYIEKIKQWKKEFFDRENKFYMNDQPYDIYELEREIRIRAKEGFKVFGIDYLNLVEMPTSKEEWKSLSSFVKKLHRLTRELGIVIIAPTQVNLTEVKEKDNKISITTRGSRELEFSATVLLFIYQNKDDFDNKVARIFTIKARNAQKNVYVAETNFHFMRFDDTGIIL